MKKDRNHNIVAFRQLRKWFFVEVSEAKIESLRMVNYLGVQSL